MSSSCNNSRWPGCAGYILSGGQSSRFGADKARATLGDNPLLVRVARVLEEALGERPRVIAGRAGAYDDLDLSTLTDLRPGQGPLAGLEAALHDSPQSWVLLTSCDLVGLQASWVEELLDHRDEGRAVAFHDGRWQPLFALYHRDLLERAAHHLDAEQRSMWRFLEDVGAVAVDPPQGWSEVVSVNRYEDLERLRDELGFDD